MNGNYSQNGHGNFLKVLYKEDYSLILYRKTKILMCFIMENTSLFLVILGGKSFQDSVVAKGFLCSTS